MQTFLPYPDYEQSAATLNRKHLFNQINECKTILSARLIGSGFSHHPATNMWRGSEWDLYTYALACSAELESQGFNANDGAIASMISMLKRIKVPATDKPWWLGNSLFHMTHRSNLKRKGYRFDHDDWLTLPDNLEYVWPDMVRGDFFIVEAGLSRIKMGIRQDPFKYVGIE